MHECPPSQGALGAGGEAFDAKAPPPCTPSGNVGAFRSRPHTP